MSSLFLSLYKKSFPTYKAIGRDIILGAGIGCSADSVCQYFIEGVSFSEIDKKRVATISTFTGS
jgi:hypothetical protein